MDVDKCMLHYRALRVAELAKASKPGWWGGVENEQLMESRREPAVGAPKKKHALRR